MPIGGVIATKGVIIPNAVGVDIGCGMCAVRTSIKAEDFTIDHLKKIDKWLRITRFWGGDWMEEFKCKNCGATFKTQEELDAHKKEKHPM